MAPGPLDDRGRIEAVLSRHARKHVGVAVGVRREGETLVVGRGRIADDRPETPSGDTIFEIGSITKVFTATALALMAREGLVGLDDPVQGFLPPDVRLPIRGRPITLADLATHTSGLPRLPKGLLGARSPTGTTRTRASAPRAFVARSRPRGPDARREGSGTPTTGSACSGTSSRDGPGRATRR